MTPLANSNRFGIKMHMAEFTPECPTCKKKVLPRNQNPVFPFCCERCRAIDLGRWLGAEFRIPTRHADEDEDGDGGADPGFS